jgi:hypothetical protein
MAEKSVDGTNQANGDACHVTIDMLKGQATSGQRGSKSGPGPSSHIALADGFFRCWKASRPNPSTRRGRWLSNADLPPDHYGPLPNDNEWSPIRWMRFVRGAIVYQIQHRATQRFSAADGTIGQRAHRAGDEFHGWFGIDFPMGDE